MIVWVFFHSQPIQASWYFSWGCRVPGDDSTGSDEGPYATKAACESALKRANKSCSDYGGTPRGSCYGFDDNGFDDNGGTYNGGTNDTGLTSGYVDTSGVSLNDSVKDVNLNNYTQGIPFYNVYDYSRISDWIKENHLRWQSYLERNYNLRKRQREGKKLKMTEKDIYIYGERYDFYKWLKADQKRWKAYLALLEKLKNDYNKGRKPKISEREASEFSKEYGFDKWVKKDKDRWKAYLEVNKNLKEQREKGEKLKINYKDMPPSLPLQKALDARSESAKELIKKYANSGKEMIERIQARKMLLLELMQQNQ